MSDYSDVAVGIAKEIEIQRQFIELFKDKPQNEECVEKFYSAILQALDEFKAEYEKWT